VEASGAHRPEKKLIWQLAHGAEIYGIIAALAEKQVQRNEENEHENRTREWRNGIAEKGA
jgi:hypothetical protein